MDAAVIWFIIGAAFMLFEIFSPLFLTLFFGIGAWAAALTAFMVPEGMASFNFEVFIFLIVTIFSLLLLRKRMVHTFQGVKSKKNPNVLAPLGRKVEVTKDISSLHEGEISVAGTFWRASAHTSISKGSTVLVLEVSEHDDLLLLVEEVFENTPTDSAGENAAKKLDEVEEITDNTAH